MWFSVDTHAGKKRSVNQDKAVAVKVSDDCCYCIVCDGMGGENGGQIASDIAVSTAEAQLSRGLTPNMNETALRRLLVCASAAANIAVYDASLEDSTLAGMGTTMIVAIASQEMAHFVHVGDSRVYLLRDDLLTQLTTDHTLVQALVERGEITKTQAEVHPQRHYITRAVGADPSTRFDQFSVDLLPDDSLLICTDGLYNFINCDDLTALTAVCVRQRNVSALIAKANENGGGDNITAAIICMGKGEALHG